DDSRCGVPHVHGVGVHDPRHHAIVGVHIGRWHVALGAEKVDDLRRVAPRDALELAIREHAGIADHATFRATKRNPYDGTFPRHPRRQRAYFIERYVGTEADAALPGAARDGMLHAV